LARSREGQLGVTGEGSLLDNAAEKEKGFVAQRRSPSPDNTRGITIAAAKYASEDAATLVNYTIAIVEYTQLCGPLKAAIERMHELEREIEENDRLQREQGEQEEEKEEDACNKATEVEELTEKDLPRLQDEVHDLQAQFDAAVVQKHSLEMELTSMKERLKAATNMIGRYG
jgi:dynein heavy chain